jgi:hypothetical protein
MAGFSVVPELWMGAGKGIAGVSEDLGRGVDTFWRAMAARPFVGDDRGRALFEGDRRNLGFVGLRDGLLRDLAAVVNLLDGMGAGLVSAGGRYVEADGAIVGDLGVQRQPRPPPRKIGVPAGVPAAGGRGGVAVDGAGAEFRPTGGVVL